MKSSWRYYLFAILLLPFHLTAQPAFRYTDRITTDDGLSSNAVSGIVQDGNGFLWIGTSYGLNRYDGTEIIKFFSKENNHSLSNNKINDLAQLDPFHIAIATGFGLSILDTRNNTFQNIFFSKNEQSSSFDNWIKFVLKDSRGNVWISSLTSLIRLDSSYQIIKQFHTQFNTRDNDKRRIEFIHKIIPLNSGDLLLWSESGVQLWDHNSDRLRQVDSSSALPWHFLKNLWPAECFKVYGHFLIATHHDSIWVYDENSGRSSGTEFQNESKESINYLQKVSQLEDGWIAFSFERKGVTFLKINERSDKLSLTAYKKRYFQDYTFRNWIQDNEGNWWISTDADGVMKIAPPKKLFQEKIIVNPVTQRPSDFEITGFYPLSHSLLLSTYGEGLYDWDPKSGNISHHNLNLHRTFQNIIWDIHRHDESTLWIGTGTGLAEYRPGTKTFHPLNVPHADTLDKWPVTVLFTDSKGLVWMGIGAGHGLGVYEPKGKTFTYYPNREGGYPFRYPLSIAEDRSGNLWFLSDNTHDLVMWNRNTGKFNVIHVSLPNGKRSLPTGNFFLDNQETIWYGVETFGLVSYQIPSGKVQVYGLDKGLNSDIIYNITSDQMNRLWLATQQGLSIFIPSSQQFINYGVSDGLAPGSYTSKFYFDSASRKMYAGSQGRIVYFSPEDLPVKLSPMQVAITQISVNGRPEPVSDERKLVLDAEENNINIHFTGINLTNGNSNIYSYQFGEHTNKWINIGHLRQLSFASLKPGEYYFAVRAARKDGVWSTVIDHLSISIKPPFTSTAWFYIIIWLGITGIIYSWYRYRLSQLRKVEKIRSGISQDLHDEIGSRLTNISVMSLVARQDQPRKSRTWEWLDRIREESQSLSQSVREIVWNINPMNDSLEEAFPRMLRYSTELLEAKGIEVNATTDNLHEIKLSMEKRRNLFLIFKEIIHNIIRHAEATQVTILLHRKKAFLTLIISDNGKGFDISKLPFHNGLSYMKQRAKDESWQLNITSKSGVGTQVNLEIKLK